MNFRNPATERALAYLLEHDQIDDTRWPSAAGPTLTVIAEPEADLDHVLDALDSADPHGRQVARRLRRCRLDGPKLGIDQAGETVYNGRRCCFELVVSLDRQLYRLPTYSEHTCPGCATRYAVSMLVRTGAPRAR